MTTMYFDTSAAVKLLIAEPGSGTAARAWSSGSLMTASALMFVQARASLAAAQRAKRINDEALSRAKLDLATMRAGLAELRVGEAILAHAGDLAERQSLRGYDAVHLSTALFAATDLLLTADVALTNAAERCGLGVVDARTSPSAVAPASALSVRA
jgi:predicted nucleic acid-binding protein